VDNNWEDPNAEEIEAYIGILIYMGLVDLPEIEDYFQGYFCVCPIVRQTMAYLFRKFFQLHKTYENAIGKRNVHLWYYRVK